MTNTTATANYIIEIETAKDQLEKISTYLEDFGGVNLGKVDWGHVGSIVKINKDMKEIRSFLNL